ncbi:hypothetical protein HDU96_001225, partial [Phlyctochytrium bullatum]
MSYLRHHFRLKFGKNFAVFSITDGDCFKNPPSAAATRGRKKRRVAFDDNVSETEQADAAELIRDGIYYPTTTEVLFLRMSDLILEIVVRANRLGYEIDEGYVTEELLREVLDPTFNDENCELPFALAASLMRFDRKIIFAFRKYILTEWKHKTDALYTETKGAFVLMCKRAGNVSGPTPPISAIDFMRTTKYLFFRIAKSWRRVTSATSALSAVIEKEGNSIRASIKAVLGPQPVFKDKYLVDGVL